MIACVASTPSPPSAAGSTPSGAPARTKRIRRGALQIVPVPAPSPDKGPGVIDFDDGTVTIEIDE